jgi:two-component system, NtrC family, sensor kinase
MASGGPSRVGVSLLRVLRGLSLRVKLFALVAVTLAAVALFLLVFFPARMRSHSQRWVENRAVGIASVLASANAPGLEFDDPAAVTELLSTLQSAPDAVYAAVRRADGSVLAAWNPSNLTPYEVEYGEEPVAVFHGGLVHVAVPILTKGGLRGSMVAAFSLSEFDSDMKEALKSVGLASGSVFAFGLALSFIIGTLLVQPIQRMTSVAHRISEGDLHAQVDLELHRADEVGKMAQAFDHMLRHLLEQRVLLESLNTQLEGRVQERTQELQQSLDDLKETQEQLLHAGKMAAMGTLVAGLSHELNNPLGIIWGYAQGLLKRSPEDHPSRPAYVAIERQTQRCRDLVRALLNFSRKLPMTRQRISCSALVERVASLAEVQARRKGVRLSWQLDNNTSMLVDVCVQEVESAILNLINNALDASSPGGEVTVEAKQVERECSMIEFAITDRGPGIPPSVLPRIFDPFFTTKPIGQGTGLGLSLTRKIIESHAGQIHVESYVGVGTQLRLWLPVADPQDKVSAS